MADKQGGFVLMTKGHFDLKAAEAVEKNFRRVQVCASKVKARAVALCNDHGLPKLAKDIRPDGWVRLPPPAAKARPVEDV
ncbi:hypothetical protein HPB52_000191 [Rhipicephalus sanguineus]|uniref:Uncharacterized protein n=1 Tax=Rhipicephalus sanguineus TaxID=34632 RepID=A0A9D4PU85_RHISA|nr:hypothetical protein HPB52_000191 [Rhipicephalus sanguineus]